jgi:MoxR-like ATPase
MLDKKLQEKYIQTFREIIFGKYFVAPSEDFIADVATAFLLRGSAVLLLGPPGVGKSTLLRLIAYELTGDQDALAIVPCSEELRPEDFIYDIDILQTKRDGALAYEFKVKARPFLTKMFAFLNEVNRLNNRTLNYLLSILAEGHAVVKDTVLKRTNGIIMMDMNPQYGSLPWAFVDRIRACLLVPALTLGRQLDLFRKKYGEDRHIEDLVKYAMKDEASMSADELVRVWEDVDRVALPEKYASTILLFTNTFSACKWDLSKMHAAFKLDCSPKACRFSDECITKQLEHPVLTRSLDHLVKMLKAEAYFAGRDHVILSEDILPALRRVMIHRVSVRPEFSAKNPSIEDWYEEEVEERLIRLQENWKRAKEVYDELSSQLKKQNVEEAVKILDDFRDEAKDVVSLKLVEVLEGDIEEACEKTFQEAYAKAILMEKGDYTMDDVKELEKLVLPPRLYEKLKAVTKRLRVGLSGIIKVKESKYKEFINALVKHDASIIRLLPFPREYGEETHIMPDGSEIKIRREYGDYVVEYNCKTRSIALTLEKVGSK